MARNPFVPRSDVERLLASLSRLVDVATSESADRAGRLVSFPKSKQAAEHAKRAIEEGLAERDAADRAEPRGVELCGRVSAALTAGTKCIDGRRALEREKAQIESQAVTEGFVVHADGCVDTAQRRGVSNQTPDASEVRRACYEHRIMSVLADMDQFQQHTVTTIRDRLGADQTGVPWTLIECARAGIDLGPRLKPVPGFRHPRFAT